MFNHKKFATFGLLLLLLAGSPTAHAMASRDDGGNFAARIIRYLQTHLSPIFRAKPAEDFPYPTHP